MAKVRNLDDLRQMFPNYTVLSAKGQTVALRNEKGRCCSYTFLENEDTVVPERIEEIAVNAVFGEGDDAISVSAEQLVGDVQAQLNSTKTALDKATAENAELTAKINAMTEAERNRRKKAVETAVRQRVKQLKETSGCDIADNFCDDLLTDEALNEYADRVDKNKAFCGDTDAVKEVNARCMELVEKERERIKKNSETHFAFEEYNKGEKGASEPTGIDTYLGEYDTATRK